MAAGGEAGVETPEERHRAGKPGQTDERPGPPNVVGDFQERVRAAEALAGGREQLHPGQELIRRDSKSFRCAGRLQGKQAEAAPFQQPVCSSGGPDAQ